jgi:hypothetical protein
MIKNRFGGVKVSVFASSESQVDRIEQTTNTIVCWLILSVYIIMSFDFPFVRLFGVR